MKSVKNPWQLVPSFTSSSLDGFSDFWGAVDPAYSSGSSPRPSTPLESDPLETALPTGSPLKFAPQVSSGAAGSSSAAGPAPPVPNDIDLASVDNLFADCTWIRSDTAWLDEGIWSEYITFPDGVELTRNAKRIFRLERVHGGMPSEIPHPPISTAYILTAPEDEYTAGMSIDKIFKSGCPHSFNNSSTGKVAGDTTIAGRFFPGVDPAAQINVRRAVPVCAGILACETLNSELISGERRKLDPDAKSTLARARLRARELQDNTRVGQVLAFVRSLEKFHCRGVRADGTRCPGKATLNALSQARQGHKSGIGCSEKDNPLVSGSEHATHPLPAGIDEAILANALAGNQIIDEEEDEQCASTMSFSKNHGNSAPKCNMNHHKYGIPFAAKLLPIACGAKVTLFCAVVAQHPTLSRVCIAVPHVDRPHLHITAIGTKCPQSIRARYEALVRAVIKVLGLGGTTTSKVENSPLALQLLGKRPAQFHPGLISESLKTRIIRHVKQAVREENAAAAGPVTVSQEIASYIAREQELLVPKRYIHSSFSRDGKRIMFGVNSKLLIRIHKLRALDVDTTFKPVDGVFQIFEINGWMCSHNCIITFIRVWMESHDTVSFRDVWFEILRLIRTLTGSRLRFKQLHQGGTLLGLNSDMEPAPLLGFAEALWDTLTDDRKAHIGNHINLLSYVLRICHVHFDRGIDAERMKVLPSAVLLKLKELKNYETRQGFDDFVIWIGTVEDPTGMLGVWWRQKTMHRWLLPGVVPALSNIERDDWHLMPPSTNLGEGQHRWNNIQTGTSMGVIESIQKYADLDQATEDRLVQAELTGDLRNEHNEVADRYARSGLRMISAGEKLRRTRAADGKVDLCATLLREAEEALSEAKREARGSSSALTKQRVRVAKEHVETAKKELNLAKAEANSNSSGRVVLPRPLRAGGQASVAQPHSPPPTVQTSSPLAPPSLHLSPSPPPHVSSPPPPPPPPPPQRPQRNLKRSSETQPQRTSKRAKGGKELDLEWGLRVDGKEVMICDYARLYPEDFRRDWPQYIPLIEAQRASK